MVLKQNYSDHRKDLKVLFNSILSTININFIVLNMIEIYAGYNTYFYFN